MPQLNSNLVTEYYWPKRFVHVRPILEYCSPVWSPYFKYLITKIEHVQRYFTRRLKGCWNMPCEQRLNTLYLESLEHRRKLMIHCFLHFVVISGRFNSNNISRKEDFCIKEALFEFLSCVDQRIWLVRNPQMFSTSCWHFTWTEYTFDLFRCHENLMIGPSLSFFWAVCG